MKNRFEFIGRSKGRNIMKRMNPKINLRNESGMALVITMGVLLLVTLAAVAFFSSQYTERNASKNFGYELVAEQAADAGLNHALLLLVEDRDNTDASNPDYQLYDSPHELWGPYYKGANLKRLCFQAGDKGMSLDAIINGTNEDARWIDIKDDQNIPVGRYLVLVTPENSKIDINSAGSYDRSAAPANEVANGYTPYAISLFELFRAIDPALTSNAERIVKWRYSGDPGAASAGPANDGNDDDQSNDYAQVDKVDNNGDGQVDEANEGVDDPYEYYIDWNVSPYVERLLGNDYHYAGAKMALVAWTLSATDAKNEYKDKNLGSFLTATSWENDLLDFSGKERIRLNHYSFPYLKAGSANADMANKSLIAGLFRDTFVNAGMPANEAGQFAVNIVDYGDYEYDGSNIRADVRTQLDSGVSGKPFLGVEKTVYIYEVNGASYDNGSDPFMDRDADNDFIELINISERPIDLNGWSIEAGGKTFTFSSTTIGAYAGWGNTANIIVVAVEKGPDPTVDDGTGTGTNLPPLDSGFGFWTRNGHSFMDDITGDAAKVVEANILGGGLDGSDRITLKDNNGNIVDVVDSSDQQDGAAANSKKATWQKKDPTTEIDTFSGDDTALGYTLSDGYPAGNEFAVWFDQTGGVWEAKHVKDRFFSSVAEIACVSSPSANWAAFIPRLSDPTVDPNYQRLLAVFDKFSIAIGFPTADMTTQVEGNPVTVPLNTCTGPANTVITPDGTGDQALAHGRININTIIEDAQRPVYSAIRLNFNPWSMGDPMVCGPLQTYLQGGNGFGEPDGNDNYKGLGGLGLDPNCHMPIDAFIEVSNLLTTKSNVFKITVIAQAYDRKFEVAAERKLEVIVDRGYVIDSSATGYSQEAKDKAKQVRVLSYRWVTEEE